MVEIGCDQYVSKTGNGWTMQREYGMTPNGNPINGQWVLRDGNGEMIAFDKYRNDLAEQHHLKLETMRVGGKS